MIGGITADNYDELPEDVCRRVEQCAVGGGDVPLLNRRPDIVVYDPSVPDDQVLRPEHCHLVVEVMSPESVTTDRTDKPAEYAAAGIGHYWRVELESERKLTMYRYRLNPTTRTYSSTGIRTSTVDLIELLA